MKVSELQSWVKQSFAEIVDQKSAEYGLAFLLEQTGQLAQAVLHRNERDVEKELADVVLVITCLANKLGVEMAPALEKHVLSRDPKTILQNINK